MKLSDKTKAIILEWMSLKPKYRELIRELGKEGAINSFIGERSPTWLSFALRGMRLSIWYRKKKSNSNAYN